MSIELNKNLLKPIKNAKPNDLNSDQNSQRIPMQLFQHDNYYFVCYHKYKSCMGLRRLWIDHLTKEIYLYFDPLTIFTWTQTRQG